jgi:hypothetical protein
LTIAAGKTLTASNTLIFTGTDSSSVAFGTGGSVLYSGGALGTPSSGTLTNCTGLPAAGVSGTALVAAAIGTSVQAYDADLTTWAGVTPGTGVATALAIAVGSAGAVVLNGGVLGTPSSGTLTNCTGLPAAGVSGTALVAAAIGTSVQAYDADLTTWAGVTPGTGVATALAIAVGSAGAVVLNGGALGTPSSGTLTNCTFPTLNQNTSGTAAGLSATLAIASGGTGQTTAQLAINALVGAVTNGYILLGNGTNVTMSAPPTWNQNTSGTAAGLSATLVIASGGTNGTATPTAGGSAYGTGTAYAFTAAGTAGHVLISNAASAPTWGAIDGGTF